MSNNRWLGDLSILDTRLTEKQLFVPPESEDYFISAAINNVDEYGYIFFSLINKIFLIIKNILKRKCHYY